MADPARRAKLVRDLEQDFVPDYDAGDKRAAYALEHIAFQNYNRVRENAGGEILPGFSAVHRPRNDASGRQNEQCLRA